MTVLIDAGIRAIAEEGIDQISVQSVSDAAKTSRPTFYSYFGDINGFLAEIWLAKSQEWLDDLSNPSMQITSLKGTKKLVNRALSEILAASHRIPEVLELVEPSMKSWWLEKLTHPPMHRLKCIWLVAERLGATITDPVDPEVHTAQFVESVLAAIPDDQDTTIKEVPASLLPAVSEPTVVSEELEARLLQSAVEVIAAGGVKSASMARVARKTQVSTGAVYPRYSKVDDLIEGSFEAAISMVIQQNFSLLQGQAFSADDFGLFVMAGLTDNRKIWRNFRIEIHLGARTRPALASRMKKNLRETNQAVASRLSIYPVPELVAGPIPYLVHSVGIGLAMLQNASIPVRELDHRPIARAMVQGLVGDAK